MASRNLTKSFKDIRTSSKSSRPATENDVGDDDGGLLQVFLDNKSGLCC